MSRRILVALAALTLVLSGPGSGPAPEAMAKTAVACDDWCAERAAARCDNIDSWRCNLYILGCLAGCNLAKY